MQCITQRLYLEHGTLWTNELILLQIGTTGPQGKR